MTIESKERGGGPPARRSVACPCPLLETDNVPEGHEMNCAINDCAMREPSRSVTRASQPRNIGRWRRERQQQLGSPKGNGPCRRRRSRRPVPRRRDGVRTHHAHYDPARPHAGNRENKIGLPDLPGVCGGIMTAKQNTKSYARTAWIRLYACRCIRVKPELCRSWTAKPLELSPSSSPSSK